MNRPYYDDDDLEPISRNDLLYQDYELASNGIWLVVVTMTTGKISIVHKI